MDDKKRGQFLRQLRVEKELTQKEVSEILHYSNNAVSNWEKGKTLPNNPETLIKLSELYNVSIEELLYGEKKTDKNTQDISNNMENIYKKNYHKFKNVFIIAIILVLVIIVISLLFIYFIFIKGKILSYSIKGTSEHFIVDKSSILLTDKIDVLNFNKIETVNNEEINYIKLYYVDSNEEEFTIFQGANDNYYIEELRGYNEYNLFKMQKEELYLEINYDNNLYEKIKLDVEQKFINDNIFHKKNTPISYSDSKANNEDNGQHESFLIEEGFIRKGENFEKVNKKIKIIYDFDIRKIYLYSLQKNSNESIQVDLNKNYLYYESFNDNNHKEKLFSLDEELYKKANIKFINDNIEYIMYLKTNL